MMLGFALAAVGMDTVTGQLRMTYGVPDLLKGFDFLIAVIGLFGIGEILLTMEEGLAFKGKSAKINPKVVFADLARVAAPLEDLPALDGDRLLDGHHAGRRDAGLVHELRHGAAHGEGPATLRQGQHRQACVAPETAAHAAGTSALLPMLTLGIPGSPTAAVLLGGLLIWGLQPGPMLFVEQKDFVWGLIASMYLGNMVGLLVVLTTVPFWAAILRIPFSVIAPVIIVICAIGAYTVHSSMFDVLMMLVFGVVGYLFKKLQATRSRRWCWRSCSATWPKRASARRCCCRRAACRSSGRTRWSAASPGLAIILLLWPLVGVVRKRMGSRHPAPA